MKKRFLKKRYLALGIVAAELAALPAMAGMVDSLSLSAEERTVFVKMESAPGQTRYAIASNTPFSIISENMIGEFNITIEKEGKINGQAFGMNAQLPGAAQICAETQSLSPQKIYQADRKTASAKGDILSQAIIVNIQYPENLDPEFKVRTRENARDIALAATCQS